MSEQEQVQKVGSESTEAAATDGLEDLEPSKDESEDVTGGFQPGPGWNLVKNPRP